MATLAGAIRALLREQTGKMEIGERYKAITEGFNSIRDDAKRAMLFDMDMAIIALRVREIKPAPA